MSNIKIEHSLLDINVISRNKYKEAPQPLQTQKLAWCQKKKPNTVKHPGTETYSGQIIIFQVQDTNLETSYQVKH